eukprot:7445920-Pyramimonas_sp.AAC.1
MRHYQFLGDDALRCFSELWTLVELPGGVLPSQLRALIVALIPKTVPGFRPIGVFSSPYRLWGRARRPIA